MAGGTGSRMRNANMPKQFMMLGDKPIIIYTLEKFLMCDRLDAIYIGIHKDWKTYLQDMIDKYAAAEKDRIFVICGGDDRNSTLMNVIAGIEEKFGESDDHIIITHDAVRPFVTLRMIEENIDKAIETGAVDTVVPATDTIVESLDGKVISMIPDRKTMYQGQTPQSFKLGLLKELYNSLTEEEKGILTDACKICVIRNYPVSLVEGSDTNMKITTPGDYKIAQAMVGGNLLD